VLDELIVIAPLQNDDILAFLLLGHIREVFSQT